ncbi:hypothetical protein LCGC14_1792970, partial [marine sediment metagenome]
MEVKEIIEMLENYEPEYFKTIGIINRPGHWYDSEVWHIKDHFKRMAEKI